MILLNSLLAGGLAVVAAPIVVHILHRRRVTRVDWGAMRFLIDLMATSRRNILIEHWLLMAVRIAALLLLAIAFMRPAMEPGVAAGDGIVRMGRTAAVLLIDDSASTATGRSETRLKRMQALATDYIDGLDAGDEISIIRLSELHQPAPDPVLDQDLARTLIEAVKPTAAASAWPDLLEAGIGQLQRHINPNVEFVLIGDGGSEGWAADARARWADLRSRLLLDESAAVGTRSRPRLLVLEPLPVDGEHNLTVADVSIDRAVVPTRMPVDIRIHLVHHGERPVTDALLRVRIDDRVVDERPVDLVAGARETVVVQHAFESAGSHVVHVAIDGARDSLAVDDGRNLAVEVIQGLPVLLVEGAHDEGLNGSLGFAAMALDPHRRVQEDEAAVADQEPAGAFAIERVSTVGLAGIDLDAYRCVVLADIAGLDNDMLARIEAYVVGGGGVLVAPGPQTDIEHINRFWARSGDGFLPCPLGPAEDSQEPLTLSVVERGHPALRAFSNDGGQAWSGSEVRRFHPLKTDAIVGDDIGVLLRLTNGSPALVERRRGLGSVALLATSLDLHWSELCVEPAFVPLIHGLVGHLGGRMLPPRNLQPGQRLAHASRSGDSVTAVDASGADCPLTPSTWQGRAVHASEPLVDRGVWTVTEGERQVHYICETDPAEGGGAQAEEAVVDQLLAGLQHQRFRDRSDLRAALDLADDDPVELWPFLLIGAVALLFAETLLCRRQSASERREPQA